MLQVRSIQPFLPLLPDVMQGRHCRKKRVVLLNPLVMQGRHCRMRRLVLRMSLVMSSRWRPSLIWQRARAGHVRLLWKSCHTVLLRKRRQHSMLGSWQGRMLLHRKPRDLILG